MTNSVLPKNFHSIERNKNFGNSCLPIPTSMSFIFSTSISDIVKLSFSPVPLLTVFKHETNLKERDFVQPIFASKCFSN
eukprot:UN23779